MLFLMCNLICAIALCSKWMSYCYLHLTDEELRLKELPASSHNDVEEPGLGLILMGSGILHAGPSPIHSPSTHKHAYVKRIDENSMHTFLSLKCLLFKMQSCFSVASPMEVSLQSERHYFPDHPAGGAVASQKFSFACCLGFYGLYFSPTLFRVFTRSLFTFIRRASDVHHWKQFVILYHLSIVCLFYFVFLNKSKLWKKLWLK